MLKLSGFHVWLVVFHLAVGTAAPAFSASLRKDIPETLGPEICRLQQKLQALQFWRFGIYDTQVGAAIVSADGAINLDEVEQTAKEQAALLKHEGYAYGRCDKSKAWLMTTPAAQAVFHQEESYIRLRTSSMQTRCRSFDLDFAPAARGVPKTLRKRQRPSSGDLQINTALLQSGTLSVTCHPHDKNNEGPELWALIPHGISFGSSAPFYSSTSMQNTETMIAWIQELRRQHQLEPLNTSQGLLSDFAAELAQNNSIRHARPRLKRQADELKRRKAKFLGENRVKAATPHDMARLLWFSPQHRRLLLNAEANTLGFRLSELEQEKLLVLVLAKI